MSTALLVSACPPRVDERPDAGGRIEAGPKVQPRQATRVRITPTTARVAFTGSKVTGQHGGGFSGFDGVWEVPADLSTSRLQLTIDLATVYTDNARLTEHLKSAEFFDVARFPRAEFTSTSFVASSGGRGTVLGQLRLHGVTQALSVPFSLTARDTGFEAVADFELNRRDFGIIYPGRADDLISDLVGLTVVITATR